MARLEQSPQIFAEETCSFFKCFVSARRSRAIAIKDWFSDKNSRALAIREYRYCAAC